MSILRRKFLQTAASTSSMLGGLRALGALAPNDSSVDHLLRPGTAADNDKAEGPDPGPVGPLSDPVSCDPRFPYPTVPLEVGNRTFWVFVDTGAQELALFENRTGAIPGTRVVREETRTVMSGREVVVQRVEFKELTLGTTHWAHHEGSLMEGSLFDGTLGPRWLGAKRIRFDFEHKVISWEK